MDLILYLIVVDKVEALKCDTYYRSFDLEGAPTEKNDVHFLEPLLENQHNWFVFFQTCMNII